MGEVPTGDLLIWPHHMNWYPAKPSCVCTADITQQSAVLKRYRHGKWDRAKKIQHYRSVDQAHFWHWEDDVVVDAPVGTGGEWVDYRDPDHEMEISMR